MSAKEILSPEEVAIIKEGLEKARPLIKEVESTYKSRLIVLHAHDAISYSTTYRIHKLLRKMPQPTESISLMLESGGGDLNSAYKILKMLKSHSKKTG